MTFDFLWPWRACAIEQRRWANVLRDNGHHRSAGTVHGPVVRSFSLPNGDKIVSLSDVTFRSAVGAANNALRQERSVEVRHTWRRAVLTAWEIEVRHFLAGLPE